MDIFSRLEFKATLANVFSGFLVAVKWVLLHILKLVKFIVFLVSSIATYLLGIFFLPGIYFAYTTFRDISKGIPFQKAEYSGLFLFAFVLPLACAFIKELSRPRE